MQTFRLATRSIRGLATAALIACAAMLAGGCAAPLMEDALSQYQCEREASNRPDAQQRRAECNMPNAPPRRGSPD